MLDTFIEDPQAFIPGNRMPFDGLKDKADREDLLAYLKVATKSSDSAKGPLPVQKLNKFVNLMIKARSTNCPVSVSRRSL